MDEETQSQLEELRRERAAHSRRLAVLREQRATYGSRSVPPHIVTDIDDANSSIAQIDDQIGKLKGRALRIEQQRSIIASAEPDEAKRDLWDYILTEFEHLRGDRKRHAEADELRRIARQRLQDLFYLSVFVMLALILYQVWR
jgi:hypothetical protein